MPEPRKNNSRTALWVMLAIVALFVAWYIYAGSGEPDPQDLGPTSTSVSEERATPADPAPQR